MIYKETSFAFGGAGLFGGWWTETEQNANACLSFANWMIVFALTISI